MDIIQNADCGLTFKDGSQLSDVVMFQSHTDQISHMIGLDRIVPNRTSSCQGQGRHNLSEVPITAFAENY
jgi:hypothetical protein